jgi:hypothetical protein
MTVDPFGAVYITGGFAGQVDFDPSKHNKIIVSTPGAEHFPENRSRDYSYNMFLLKLNSAGDYQAVQTFGSTSDDWATDVALTPAGGVVMTGRFKGTVDFRPGPKARNMRSHGLEDAVVIYLSGDLLR